MAYHAEVEELFIAYRSIVVSVFVDILHLHHCIIHWLRFDLSEERRGTRLRSPGSSLSSCLGGSPCLGLCLSCLSDLSLLSPSLPLLFLRSKSSDESLASELDRLTETVEVATLGIGSK